MQFTLPSAPDSSWGVGCVNPVDSGNDGIEQDGDCLATIQARPAAEGSERSTVAATPTDAVTVTFDSIGRVRANADASLLADRLINQIWVDRASLATYAYGGSGAASTTVDPWLNTVKGVLPAANAVVAVSGSQVTVTITWQPPGSGQTRTHTAVATIQEP